MNIVLLGAPSPLLTLCFEAVAHLLQLHGGGDPHGAPGAGARLGAPPYALHGVFTGVRKPFDAERYLAVYGDLAQAFGGDHARALAHFIEHGLLEGRNWGPTLEVRPDHLVFAVEKADAKLLGQWREAGFTVIAVLDEPLACLRQIRAHGMGSRRQAVARISGSLACVHDLIVNSGVPVVARASETNLAETVEYLVRACGWHSAMPALASYLRREDVGRWLAAETRGTGDPPSTTFEPAAAAEPDDVAVEQILAGGRELARRRPISTVGWPGVMFVNPDALAVPPTAFFDMTGPARAIVKGPNLYLPAGAWSCDLQFAVADNHQGCRFGIDIWQLGATLRAIAVHDFTLPERGTFNLTIAFEVTDPSAPLEVRCHTREGLIGGEFQLIGAHLRRL